MITVCPTCGSEVDQDDLTDMEEIAAVAGCLGLSRACAVMFLALWDANGRILTFDSLMDAKDHAERNARSTLDSTRCTKKRLVIALAGHPVEIMSHYGMGYSLRRLDPDWHWRGA